MPWLGPTFISHPPIRTWIEWASPSVKVSTSSVRSDLFARPSSCTPNCSLYHSLVRTGKAEMKYIADYPADTGSLTRLHVLSGQGGLLLTDISQKSHKSVTEPAVNEFSSLTMLRGRDSLLDHMFRLRTLQLDYLVIHVFRIFDHTLSSYVHP